MFVPLSVLHRITPSLQRLAPWGLAAIALALGLAFGACTQDDAFISFRYAENLLHGHGLVYNVGERVEGYTNFLWTLLLAGCMALGADPVVASILLGLCSLAGLVVLTYTLGRQGGGRGAVACIGAALLAVDASLALESVEGLETTLYALLLAGGVGFGLAEPRFHWRAVFSGVLLGLAALTRPEAPLVWCVLQGVLLLQAAVAGGRRGLVRGGALALWSALPFWGLVGGHLCWRLAYYGAWVPNTFYAKTGSGGWAMVERGLHYLGAHAWSHPVLWGLVVLRLVSGRWSGRSTALLAICGSYLAYVVLVGGDFKPTGRFIIPVMAFLALLAQEEAGLLAARVKPAWRVLGSLLMLALAVHGYLGLGRAAWAVAEERHANLEARMVVGDWLAAHFPPDTLLAIHSAGVIPYYAGLPTIDMWGLTDAHIARVDPGHMGTGLAGHEKTDPAYVFDRQPDLYLPEDRVFTLRPWELQVEKGFPADFPDRYRSVSVPVSGRWLNFWLRRQAESGGA